MLADLIFTSTLLGQSYLMINLLIDLSHSQRLAVPVFDPSRGPLGSTLITTTMLPLCHLPLTVWGEQNLITTFSFQLKKAICKNSIKNGIATKWNDYFCFKAYLPL